MGWRGLVYRLSRVWRRTLGTPSRPGKSDRSRSIQHREPEALERSNWDRRGFRDCSMGWRGLDQLRAMECSNEGACDVRWTTRSYPLPRLIQWKSRGRRTDQLCRNRGNLEGDQRDQSMGWFPVDRHFL